ncbi:hypothetical protein [Glaciecola sp. SC05]|uniref:hypothetical protein n=1 Tax=Glaciecola sp. SC05 TaxID=1987355 RepID=UPI003526C64D
MHVNVDKNPFSQRNCETGRDVIDVTIAVAKNNLEINWHNDSVIRVRIFQS